MATLTHRFSIRLTDEDVARVKDCAQRSPGARPQAVAREAMRLGLAALAKSLPRTTTDEGTRAA